jgi:3',5'-cyclic AMP phosphodiesterase CpdA
MPTRALVVLLLLATGCYQPAEPTGPIRETTEIQGAAELVVIGDFGSGDANEYAVARAIRGWARDHPVDALVTTGDNIYENGHPDRFEEAWHRPYGWLADQGIDVLASLGNHDVRTDRGRPVMRLLGMPGPWYSHRLGPVEIVVLDGNRPQDEDQVAFLRAVLGRSEAAWQVVVVHHPPYSCADEHGSSEEVQALVPALADGGVDVVLSGHDHLYQRFRPIEGVTFVVSGGGGAGLDNVAACPPDTPSPAAAFDDGHHFLYVRATEGALRIRAIPVPDAGFSDDVKLVN